MVGTTSEVHQPCVLVTVTITYRGDGFFGRNRRTESFQGIELILDS